MDDIFLLVIYFRKKKKVNIIKAGESERRKREREKTVTNDGHT